MKKFGIPIIGIIVTILIIYIASLSKNILEIRIDFIPKSFVFHTIILCLSILAIYLLRKYVNYRIEFPKFKTLIKPIGFGLLISLLSAMIMSAIMFSSSENVNNDMKMPISNLSIMQIIMFVFIYASISEELIFRGFLLNILSFFKNKGISIFHRKISYPILISAMMFGLFHIIPFNNENNMIYTLGMLIAPFLLGIVAGYYQEKYDNNFYAIIVHMSGNLIGIIGVIVMSINT